LWSGLGRALEVPLQNGNELHAEQMENIARIALLHGNGSEHWKKISMSVKFTNFGLSCQNLRSQNAKIQHTAPQYSSLVLFNDVGRNEQRRAKRLKPLDGAVDCSHKFGMINLHVVKVPAL
jgi:hypothetical protein